MKTLLLASLLILSACAPNRGPFVKFASAEDLENSNKRIATLESRIEELESRMDKMSIKMIQIVANQSNSAELLSKIQYQQDRQLLYLELADINQELADLIKEMDSVQDILKSLKKGKW